MRVVGLRDQPSRRVGGDAAEQDGDVKLPGSDQWKTFGEGDSFQIEGNESFTVRITDTVAYLCPYT
ncbi:pyrimidine/purine nucleoside phosphorylase [Saccharopolyspora sp. NPDC002686]|uniref:pyrimidine/purine nucleoside phosphorylase n=1 Tax=Saccharopolyspora sp. NPDC002686 TaxID=3154541 RepID=UPI00331DFB2E